MIRRQTFSLVVSGIALGAAVLPGCLLLSGLDDRGAGTYATGVLSDAQSCGVKGFAYFVRPKIRSACASCHSGSGPGVGSFAAYDVAVGYGAARARATLSNPGGSLLVNRSKEDGHGIGCSICGPAWGATLTEALSQWAQAEANSPSICASLPAVGGTAEEFDDGTYSPGAATEIVVIPAGLTKFRETGGLHSVLKTNCADCHYPGRSQASAAFAQNDEVTAYKAAKLRVNFASIQSSLIYTRGSTTGHGASGCTACGTPALIDSLNQKLAEWQAQEFSGAQEVRVSLASGTIAPLADGASKVLSWNVPNGGGAKFQITIERRTALPNVYRFSNPKIVGSTLAINVSDIRFVVNGVEQSSIATYTTVDTQAPAGVTTVLSTSPALVSIGNVSTDTFGFSFFKLAPP